MMDQVGATQRKQCIRLLKIVMASPNEGVVFKTIANTTLVVRKSQEIIFENAVVNNCLSRGLLRKKLNFLSATPEAKTGLRRLLSEVPDYKSQHGIIAKRPSHGEQQGDALLQNVAESPLSRLQMRPKKCGSKFLEVWEFEAGQRIRVDFEQARLAPSISARCETVVSTGGTKTGNGREAFSNVALDAKKRFHAASDFMGPELNGVVVDVCCFLKGLELVERERQWPARSAKMLLKAGLSKLARHYGLIAVPRMNDGGHILHWGTRDFRPSVR